MNKLLSLIVIAAAAVSCTNNQNACVELNDSQLVGNWKAIGGDVTISLYKNGSGSFEANKEPNLKALDESRINWATFNNHTIVWNFYKEKSVWSYWISGDTLNVHDGGIGTLGKPNVDEHLQFIKQK